MLTIASMADEIAARLREAIAEGGVSYAELARQTGVPQPTITRFMDGTDIRISTASKLAVFFGLSLTGDKPPKRKR